MINTTGILLCIGICVISVTGRSFYLSLPRGSSCVWNGMNGNCVHSHRCLSTVEDIKMGLYPPICSFEGSDVVICCTDCELVEDTRNLVNTTVGIYYKNGRKAKDHCLDYIKYLNYPCKYHFRAGLEKVKDEDRKCYKYFEHQVGAAGGRNARRDEYLHMALLGYGSNVKSAQWLCGGSVISGRYILTAAHCISSPTLGPVRYAALGILKRTDPEELWQRYRIQKIIPHPEYQSPSKYHDIALLKTTKKISFNQYVLPACLHSDLERDDNEAQAIGWGALGHRRELADHLQTVFLKKYQAFQCTMQHPPHRHLLYGYNHRSQMCYGHQKLARDTCEGDSGGPLENTQHPPSCSPTIIGVTSYGKGCGVAGGSGMYTRVIYYLPWIESVVWLR